jgi:hypothetical protein
VGACAAVLVLAMYYGMSGLVWHRRWWIGLEPFATALPTCDGQGTAFLAVTHSIAPCRHESNCRGTLNSRHLLNAE